jgi:predicted metal-dependent HD superfamily phosphohydrolase
MNNIFINKVKKHVIALLDKNTPVNHVYHNSKHTMEVAEAVEIIGTGMNVADKDLEILLLAAYFHDLGYLNKSEGHEKESAEYANEYLSKENYPADRIKKIQECILATKVPQRPHDLLEEIICDADLSHLGTEMFDNRNDMFRNEFEFYSGQPLSQKEWLKKSIDFLKHHKFFTDFAIKNFEKRKGINLLKLQAELDKLNEEVNSKKKTADVENK